MVTINNKVMRRNSGEFWYKISHIDTEGVSVVIYTGFNIFQYCHSTMMRCSPGVVDGFNYSSYNIKQYDLLVLWIVTSYFPTMMMRSFSLLLVNLIIFFLLQNIYFLILNNSGSYLTINSNQCGYGVHHEWSRVVIPL